MFLQCKCNFPSSPMILEYRVTTRLNNRNLNASRISAQLRCQLNHKMELDPFLPHLTSATSSFHLPQPTTIPEPGKATKLGKCAEKAEIRGVPRVLTCRTSKDGRKLERARGVELEGREKPGSLVAASTRSCSTWQVARSMMRSRWMKLSVLQASAWEQEGRKEKKERKKVKAKTNGILVVGEGKGGWRYFGDVLIAPFNEALLHYYYELRVRTKKSIMSVIPVLW